MASYLDDWTEEQVEVVGELGFDEMEHRAEKLHRYYKWDTVATIYGDRTLTPEQAIAWAKFAQTLGKDHVINNTEIQKPRAWKSRCSRSSRRSWISVRQVKRTHDRG